MILVHDGITSSTKIAQLVRFGDEMKWVPDRLIIDKQKDTIEIEDWWVEKEELECYAE